MYCTYCICNIFFAIWRTCVQRFYYVVCISNRYIVVNRWRVEHPKIPITLDHNAQLTSWQSVTFVTIVNYVFLSDNFPHSVSSTCFSCLYIWCLLAGVVPISSWTLIMMDSSWLSQSQQAFTFQPEWTAWLPMHVFGLFRENRGVISAPVVIRTWW